MLITVKQANTIADLSVSGQIEHVSYHCSACGGSTKGRYLIFAVGLEYFLLAPEDYAVEAGMLAVLNLESEESYAFVADVYVRLEKEELLIYPVFKWGRAKVRIFPNGKIIIGELGHVVETTVMQYKSEDFLTDGIKAFIEERL